MTEALIILAAPFGSYWLGRRLLLFYCKRGAVKPNYRGKNVAPALGPALLLGYLAAAAAAAWAGDSSIPWLAVTVLFLGVSFYGLWDDFLEESVSGFSGHFRAGLRGVLSAGLLKVITAGLVVLIFVSTLPPPLPGRLTAFLLILLSANGINLLDRRPGRALKAFFAVGLLILFAAGPFTAAAALLLPLMAAALVLAPLDFSAEGMLGDCGANLLGAALGVAAVLYWPLPAQLLLMAAWAGMNLICERTSISHIIDHSSLLRFLDGLGRGEEKLS